MSDSAPKAPRMHFASPVVVPEEQAIEEPGDQGEQGERQEQQREDDDGDRHSPALQRFASRPRPEDSAINSAQTGGDNRAGVADVGTPRHPRENAER